MKSRMSHVLIYNNYNVSVSKRANAYKRYDFIIHFTSKFVVNTEYLTSILTDEVTDFHCGGRFPRALLQPLPSLCSVQGLQYVLFPQESPPPLQSAKKFRKILNEILNINPYKYRHNGFINYFVINNFNSK